MNIRAGKHIIPGMDITALLSTNAPDTLRKLALSLLEESHKKDHQIHLLKEALILARQQRFGRQAESFSGSQRSLFEEDADADIAAAGAGREKSPSCPQTAADAPATQRNHHQT